MDAREKSFEFAQEVTKQLLALATGVIALTITFLVDVPRSSAESGRPLLVAWILFLVSIAFGIASLMAMAGSLARKPQAEIYDRNISIPAALQVLTFLGGLVAAVLYATTLVP